MAHALSWFEIPVTDFARSKTFYEKVLAIRIEPMVMGTTTMGMLSSDPNAVSGALVLGADGSPSVHGTLVYLNGGDDLAPMLALVSEAGGSVVVPKTEIGNGFGYFAHFMDSEGNKIGLHSMK